MKSFLRVGPAFFFLAHCASAETSGASDSANDAGPAPNVVSDSGPTVTPACGSVDEPDDDATDTNCDGVDGVVGRDVYVSIERGSDTNDGKPTSPVRTLRAAMQMASARDGDVLLEYGTYDIDEFLAKRSIRVGGGYNPNFASRQNREASVLTSASTGLLVGASESVRLSHVSIRGSRPTDAKLPTAYGIRSRAQKLFLDDVVVTAADGLAAPAGVAGDSGAQGVDVRGPLNCDGAAQPSYTMGLSSGDANVRAVGVYLGNANSVRVFQADPGAPGADGIDARDVLSLKDDFVVGDIGTNGVSDGKPGFGGYPGGGGTFNGRSFRGGTGGSGGCPGKGGFAAESGGASIALLVLAGEVSVTRSRLQTGLGGTGGEGGVGGPGGAGGRGSSPTNDAGFLFPNTTCNVASFDPMGANCSAFGGNGGNGGAGGRGAAGAGGASLGIVRTAASKISTDPATEFGLGAAGLGGVGNGGARAAGGKRSAQIVIE